MYQRFGIMRGVNLGGWLSQCNYSEDRLMNFITEPDFARIASWKMDHVRLPVDYNVLQNEDGSFKPAGFERLDFALAMCRKYGLKLVIDLHATAGYFFGAPTLEGRTAFFRDAKYQEMFYALWCEIARHYGGEPDLVAFELLNEVTDPSFKDVWNDIACEAVRRIRAIAPDSFICFGGHTYNNVKAVASLAAPLDDKVIYVFHSYDPFRFTHQGARWEPAVRDVRTTFEESGASEEFFEELYAPAIEAARKNGTTLYCSEYGAIENTRPEDVLRYVETIGSVFRRHSIPHSIWNYKSLNFGLTNPVLDEVRDEVIAKL